jgi:hypothetical protein
MRRSPDLLRSAPARKAGAARREGRGDSRMRRNTHTHKRRHNPADERRPRFDENHANARVGAVRVRVYTAFTPPFFRADRTAPTAFRVIRKQRQETVASGSVRDVDFIGYQRAGLSYPVYANTHEEGRRRRGRGGDQKNEEKVGGHVSFEFRPGMHSDARRTHNYYYGGPIYFIRTATHT